MGTDWEKHGKAGTPQDPQHQGWFSGINIPIPRKNHPNLHSQNLTLSKFKTNRIPFQSKCWLPKSDLSPTKPGSVGSSNPKAPTAPHILEQGYPEHPKQKIPEIPNSHGRQEPAWNELQIPKALPAPNRSLEPTQSQLFPKSDLQDA